MNKYYQHRKAVADTVDPVIVPEFEKVFRGDRRTCDSIHAYTMGFIFGRQNPLLSNNASIPNDTDLTDATLQASATINALEDLTTLIDIEETLDEQIERLR